MGASGGLELSQPSLARDRSRRLFSACLMPKQCTSNWADDMPGAAPSAVNHLGWPCYELLVPCASASVGASLHHGVVPLSQAHLGNCYITSADLPKFGTDQLTKQVT